MIRQVQLSDLECLAKIHVSSWQVAYRDLLPAEYLAALNLDQRIKQWQGIIAHQGDNILLYEQTQKVMGFSNFGPCRDPDTTPRRGEIYAIYLHPQHYRQGIGSCLLTASLSHLQIQGFDRITLWVIEHNRAAIFFYQQHGFGFDGEDKSEMIGGQAVRCMRMASSLSTDIK